MAAIQILVSWRPAWRFRGDPGRLAEVPVDWMSKDKLMHKFR